MVLSQLHSRIATGSSYQRKAGLPRRMELVCPGVGPLHQCVLQAPLQMIPVGSWAENHWLNEHLMAETQYSQARFPHCTITPKDCLSWPICEMMLRTVSIQYNALFLKV